MSVLVPEVEPAQFGRSYRDWLDVTTPAAGATQSVTVEGGWFLRVLAARATIATDANAANRFVSLDYLNARGVTYHQNGAGLVLTANTSATVFDWDHRRTVGEWAANTPVFAPLLDEWLPPGFTVKFNVANIQATDALTALHLWVEKLPTGVASGPENAFPYLPR